MLATIGYERSTLRDFIATLQLKEAHTLIDVRERAQSRRPGFSKKALSEALKQVGIAYVHFPELGDPKPGRDAARTGNFQLFIEIYSKVLDTAAAKQALSRVEHLASESVICLMCYERNEKDCHRKIISDKIEKNLNIKTDHWGVPEGISDHGRDRRVLYTYQSPAASL